MGVSKESFSDVNEGHARISADVLRYCNLHAYKTEALLDTYMCTQKYLTETKSRMMELP